MDSKKHFLLGLLAALLLGVLGQPAWSHDPHDVAQQVEMAPDYGTSQTAYLLVRGNFLKSTDGGSTWQRQVQGLAHQTPLTAFAIAPNQPQRVYVTSEGDGLFQSNDGGRSWQTINQGLTERSLTQVAVSAENANTVFVAGHDAHLYRRGDG